MSSVYKVLRQQELTTLIKEKRLDGSDDDRRDGYIHLCTFSQLPDTLFRHFAGENNVFLAVIKTTDLDPHLNWEPSRGGELFPHLYRPLALSDVKVLLPPPIEAALKTANWLQRCDKMSL